MSQPETPTTLYTWHGRSDTIAGAYTIPPAKLPTHDPIYGFAYTPTDCLMLKVDSDGRAMARGRDGTEGPLALDDVFDLRLFCRTWEFRWRRDGDSARVALLAEGACDPAALGLTGLTGESKPTVAANNQYLLWGEPAKGGTQPPHDNGWTRLTTARLGALWVPCEAAGRVALTTREYFIQPKDKFGNWVFWTERLTGFVDLGAAKDKE